MSASEQPIVMRPSYSVIVVDPPWAYGKDTGRTRTAERHYKTVGNNGKEINRKTGEGVLSIVESVDIPSLAAKDLQELADHEVRLKQVKAQSKVDAVSAQALEGLIAVSSIDDLAVTLACDALKELARK